jgi:hypothetical protein
MDLRSKVSRDGRVVLPRAILNGWISGPTITCTTGLRQEAYGSLNRESTMRAIPSQPSPNGGAPPMRRPMPAFRSINGLVRQKRLLGD